MDKRTLYLLAEEKIVDAVGRATLPFRTKWQELIAGHKGVLVKKSADQTGANYSGGSYVTWDTETYDTTAFHSTTSNTDRFTIPAGVTKVRVGAQITLDNITANAEVIMGVGKNSGFYFPGVAFQAASANATTVAFQVWSPVVEVLTGDYFRVLLQVPSDSSIDVIADNSWFALEVVR